MEKGNTARNPSVASTKMDNEAPMFQLNQGVASCRFGRFFLSCHLLLPTLVSKCAATLDESWPLDVIVLLILFRYASTVSLGQLKALHGQQM